jgi:RNA recognition motif-containing protein
MTLNKSFGLLNIPSQKHCDVKIPVQRWLSRNGLEKSVTIYVGNLSFQAEEEDIREVFSEYGKVSRVSLPTDRETGRKRGFAFVDMESDAEEDAAIAELDGAEWLGRELKVNKAKPREGGGGRGNGR